MRRAATAAAVLLTLALAACSSPHAAPTHSPTATSTRPGLTGAAAAEAPIVCRAVHDYDTVQTAIGSGDLTAVHRAGAAAAADDEAGFVTERRHSWPSKVRPLLAAYFAKGAEQVQYYRDIAKAKSITDAVDLQFPDGTTVSTPVLAAIHFPTDYSCPS